MSTLQKHLEDVAKYERLRKLALELFGHKNVSFSQTSELCKCCGEIHSKKSIEVRESE